MLKCVCCWLWVVGGTAVTSDLTWIFPKVGIYQKYRAHGAQK